MTPFEVPISIAPEAARTAILAALTKEVRQLERARISLDQRVSSGSGGLNAILPEQGFRRATLVEWLNEVEGSGAATLALVAAREACRSGGMLVTVEPPGSRRFYPPAAAALGVVLERTIVVRPTNAADFQWAVHQALGCPGVAAVVCWTENLQGSASGKLDDRMFRRWQLAAERGTSLGLLIRPGSVAGNPSWAEVQLRVRSLPTAAEVVAPRRLRVEVLRCRGGRAGGSVQLEIDPETGLNPEIGLENQRGLAYFAMPCEQNVPVPLARQS
jgi:cell division inhibitor SulA/protein ImuA